MPYSGGGGMASNALKQLIIDAAWGELDYFVLDLPPGTSDIHLTLVQTLAITGAIVVTTPQRGCFGRCPQRYQYVYRG